MENAGSMDDIQNLFRETIAEFMENDMGLGYSKLTARTRVQTTAEMDKQKNTAHKFNDVEISVPQNRKGEFEPQALKKNQISIS